MSERKKKSEDVGQAFKALRGMGYCSCGLGHLFVGASVQSCIRVRTPTKCQALLGWNWGASPDKAAGTALSDVDQLTTAWN